MGACPCWAGRRRQAKAYSARRERSRVNSRTHQPEFATLGGTMRMRSGDASVELAIEGYQFPEMAPIAGSFDHDANWLQVRGAFHANGIEWSFVDPCLMTVEAQELLDWLREVAVGGSPDELWFTEPNLTFGLDESNAESVVLRVCFSHESAPEKGSEAPVHIILEVPLMDVESAAEEWASELAAFPVR